MSECVNKDINVNINVNVNIKVNMDFNNTNNWANISEDSLMYNLFKEIEHENIAKIEKKQKTIEHIINLFDNINVDFEPDESYRDNVKYMILGLVLSQILKQKTINLYRKGKEDREYLGSFLMMKVQSYLLKNNSTDEWNDIIMALFDHYKNKIRRNEEMNNLIKRGINTEKFISQDILISTIISNKKNYILKKNKEPISYE